MAKSKKLEREILEIINNSSQKRYGHKFSSLQDTCSNPEPPYTVKVTPLVYFLLHDKHIVRDNPQYEREELFTKERIDCLVKNSPLHNLYSARQIFDYPDEPNDFIKTGYVNPLIIALYKNSFLKLFDEQFNHMIKNSDLEVNKNEGATALNVALHDYTGDGIIELSKENWDLLKKSILALDESTFKTYEEHYNKGTGNSMLLQPQQISELRAIYKEQKTIADKDNLDAVLAIKEVSNSSKGLKI